MSCLFVLAGDLASFDAAGFKAGLEAQFPAATSIEVFATAASVNADVAMIFPHEAAAMAAAERIRSTDPDSMASDWFDGAVTILNQPSPTVSPVDATVPPPSPPSSPPSSQTLAISLGVGGAVLVLLGVVLLLLWRRYRRMRQAEARRRELAAEEEAKQETAQRAEEAERGECRFWFVSAAQLLARDDPTLPSFQELQATRPGLLVEKTVTRLDAFKMGYSGTHLAVSHRWFDGAAPDRDGLQLGHVRHYLRSHPGIEWVWYDYWCMPQGKQRTPKQQAAFDHMLSNINWLYLGCSVLILLDLSYISRFWTQFEAWLALQCTSADGLTGARDNVRTTIEPIYNANSTIAEYLMTMWANKSPEEALAILEREDVTVTNQSDKTSQLPKLSKLADEVRAVLSGAPAEKAASAPTQEVSNVVHPVASQLASTRARLDGARARASAAARAHDAAAKAHDAAAKAHTDAQSEVRRLECDIAVAGAGLAPPRSRIGIFMNIHGEDYIKYIIPRKCMYMTHT